MTISIALRFIPTLLEDAMRVMRAQSSRGVDFQHGNIWKRLTGITALIIPLFVSSFIRSEELANAMECRCYDPRAERTKYRKLKFHFRDAIAFIVAAGFLAAAIYFSVSKMNFFAFTGV
jgi:energy-coupling factor transport system permease protein